MSEDLEKPEQDLEVLGLALEALTELRGDRQRRDAVGLYVTGPYAGNVSLARGFVVLLLSFPVIVFDGETTGGFECTGFVAALPENRQAIGGFDGEFGPDDLLEMRKARNDRALGGI